MKASQIIMGMPVTVEIIDAAATEAEIEKIFDYFRSVDEKFSTYKAASEISQINRKELPEAAYSREMREVLELSEGIKRQSGGFFEIRRPDGKLDPSGLVKGWAINKAAGILAKDGFKNFYVEAGGDIQASGKNTENQPWTVGIKNPFKQNQIIKIVEISNAGLATSGSYIRGQHIYNPKQTGTPITDIVSLTVIGPNVYQADCFATAAFAMGRDGIYFIEKFPGLEGYVVDKNGIGTETNGFAAYVKN
jgi:thiamine biosynthesis lipoprotein